MMCKTFLTGVFISLASVVVAQQQSLTLDICLAAAMKNHPLSGQNALYEKSTSLQQQNMATAKLPQLNINGQATYQNEVIQLPFKVPGVTTPEVPKAQYKLSVDANQLIFNGGITGLQQNIEDYNRQINQVSNEADLYKVRERINQLYFSILLADINAGVINNTIGDLTKRLTKVYASVKDGVMLPSAADILQVEILKAGQRLVEVNSQKQALSNTLQVLTGLAIAENAVFVEPQMEVDLMKYSNQRPEYAVFGLMQQKLEATKQLSVSKDLPKVYGFGTAGFGNPGYNVFKEGTSFFYTVGAKVSWNFWNWNQTNREKQLIELNSHILNNQKNAYDLTNRALVQQYLAEVIKASELLKSDDEILKLRKSITQAAAAQLENGTITATEYITEQLAEEQVLLNRNLHKMQLLQAKSLYKAATGGL